MANIIKIKRGTGTSTLLDGELGFNTSTNTLYIGNGGNKAIGGSGAFLPLSGGTLTGGLTATGLAVSSAHIYPSTTLKTAADNRAVSYGAAMAENTMYGQVVYNDGKGYAEYYMFPDRTSGETGNAWHNILTSKNPVTIAQGGTGATTAANARKNLAVPYYAKYDAGNLQTGANNTSAWFSYYGDDGTNYNQMDLTKTATVFRKPVDIASGGTGATTASGALINLGAVSLETFNNRRIGGRNLFRHLPLSKMPFGTGDSSGSNTIGTVAYDAGTKSLYITNTNSNLRLEIVTIPVQSGETYTVSCWTASAIPDATKGELYQFQIECKNNDGALVQNLDKNNTIFKSYLHADITGNGWQWRIISQTFTAPSGTTKAIIRFRTGFDYEYYTNAFHVKNFKFEQGPIVTDWIPAVEDIITIEGGSIYESLQIGTGKSRHLNLWAGDDGVTKIGHQDASWFESNAIYLYDTHTYFKKPIQIIGSQFWENGSNNSYGIDLSNSDVMNANGIYFTDDANAAGEGINFARGTNTWDTLSASGGKLYFAPNRAKDSIGTRYEVYHSGGVTIPVSKGGTGATTAEQARKNLAVPYYAKYDAGNLQTGAGNVSAWITYYGDDGTSYNQMDLGKTATSFSKPVNIASGGTGATSASGALINLGALSKSGSTIDSQAFFTWADAGHFNQGGVSYPYKYGGLRWAGESDGVDLFAEETASDNLDLVIQFKDDNSNNLQIRDKTGNKTLEITANGRINAYTSSGYGYASMWADNEGGNFEIKSNSGTYIYQMDAAGNDYMRLIAFKNGTHVQTWTFGAEDGKFSAPQISSGGALAVGGTLYANNTIQAKTTGTWAIDVKNPNGGEASISYSQVNSQQWVLGVGCGGSGDTFALWNTQLSRNVITVNRSNGKVTLTGPLNIGATSDITGITYSGSAPVGRTGHIWLKPIN